MCLEAYKRPGRIGVGELGQHRLAPVAALAPVRVIQANARGEIGPAVPLALLDLVEVIGVVEDVAPAAFVHAMFGGEQAAVGVEGDAIRVAQPPGHHLQVRAVGVAAQDCAGRFDPAGDDLPGARLQSRRARRPHCAPSR